MRLTSPAFEHEGKIPSKYTCQGHNINPPLEFSEVPFEAKSLVLLMDDPDVPAFVRKECMYDHWVIFNMPSDTQRIDENSTPPGIQGKNTAGASAYTGPCPPDREHRYFFMLYALDTMLQLDSSASKDDVKKAMAGHIIVKAELMARYEKK
jgi:Raf kinase inhibitor-like YbhB/YbcL family protein